jgi:putative endopeptidase
MRLFTLFLLFPLLAPAQTADTLKFDIGAVDRTANPCADFYQYACGGWLQHNPIAPDRSYSAIFQQMRELNQARVSGILHHAASSPANAGERKIGDYFASCMDNASIERQGLALLRPELARIDAIANRRQLSVEIARLHSFGTDPLFSMYADQMLEDATQVIAYLDQSGLNLPSIEDYNSAGPEAEKARQGYRAHLQRVFALIGQSQEQAAIAAEDVLKIETTVAAAELTPVQRRDRKAWYHLMTAAELEKLVPDFSWNAYFATIGFTPKARLNIAVPSAMRAVEQLLQNSSITSWKNYLRWELARVATPALPLRFRDAEFDFYQRTLRGVREQESRDKQCTTLTNRDLGEAVGKQYAERYFPAPSKQRVLAMVARIRQAFHDDIAQSPWMDADTRREALRKLDSLRVMIGYPDHWRDYSRLVIQRGDALGNALRGQQFEFHRQIAKIGKPVDRGEFYELVQDVEGYHDNPLNVVVFTAGILQPPFFDPQMDDGVNFGLTGAVIGHEISHAFDDKGHLFDGEGNMRDWWTPPAAENYNHRAACFVQQYSQYPAVGDLKVNGELTLGENIADNGGLQVAHMAFDSGQSAAAPDIDGYSPEQRFFLAWAQWRCMNITEKRARELARTDEHSPGRWRVNGVVSNMPSFAAAYKCKPGHAMVRSEPCRIW